MPTDYSVRLHSTGRLYSKFISTLLLFCHNLKMISFETSIKWKLIACILREPMKKANYHH